MLLTQAFVAGCGGDGGEEWGRQALAKGVTKGTRSKQDAYFLCVCTLQRHVLSKKLVYKTLFSSLKCSPLPLSRARASIFGVD